MKTTELDDILNDIIKRRPVSLLQAERAQSELTTMRAELAYNRSHADTLIEFATTKMDMQALELTAMRQIISEQMERIQQQQAVVDAAKTVEKILPDLLDAVTLEDRELAAFEALAAALAALPQLATKGKP
jgi:hypothetical protein